MMAVVGSAGWRKKLLRGVTGKSARQVVGQGPRRRNREGRIPLAAAGVEALGRLGCGGGFGLCAGW